MSACDELDGMPPYQVIRFHVIAPISAARITQRVHALRAHDALADRARHAHAEPERRHEVEERGPDHGLGGAEHPGGDDGRDRVGRVVEAVDEVEDQGDER